MSRWSSWGWSHAGPKPPPPERGIRVKAAGATWWGQRWIAALQEVLDGDSARLARGRSYARAGRTHDLEVRGGKVTAKVTGSRPKPYQIEIELARLSAAAWAKALAAMASEARFSAELLAGRMPETIDEAFRAAGVSLFPAKRADLVTSCSCPDWGDPCKHVAATHYVLGEALDRDPFLLFELRGMTKDAVLAALREARGADEAPAKRVAKAKATPREGAEAPARAKGGAREPSRVMPGAPPEVPTVKLGKLKAVDYDAPRAPLPVLRFAFDEPAAHGAVLRQLGVPAVWEGEASPAEVLAPVLRAAAEHARRLALAESSEGGEPVSAAEPTKAAARPAAKPTKAAARPAAEPTKAAARPAARKVAARRARG